MNNSRRVLGAIAGVAVFGGLIVGCIWTASRSKPAPVPEVERQVAEPPTSTTTTTAPGANGSPAATPWTAWPPHEVVLGPPAGWADKSPQTLKKADAPPTVAAGPLTAGESSGISQSGDFDAAAVRAQLLDAKKTTAQKLLLIEKLKVRPAAESIPVLAAFLEGEGGTASAAAKPSAVKVLSEMKNPQADLVLSRLSYASGDEQVRLTIAALWAKEKSK